MSINQALDMKITIVYDNDAWKPGLQADWGFACLIEAGKGYRLLFDTGAKGEILLQNMAALGLDPQTITDVFISHSHWDHMGGLPALLELNREAAVYLPASCPKPPEAREAVSIQGPCQLTPQFGSTGELNGGEQSLVVDTGKGLAVVCGCAHPGVGVILRAAARFGRVNALVGGLHGFKEFDLLRDMALVCPCHCKRYKAELEQLYPESFILGGAGKILEV
jgi:7,8-dihydropterin-6-yl-methyl-4-(beta-D-ribofuranosyl)aminobenzene 5'-phosphate synthase